MLAIPTSKNKGFRGLQEAKTSLVLHHVLQNLRFGFRSPTFIAALSDPLGAVKLLLIS